MNSPIKFEINLIDTLSAHTWKPRKCDGPTDVRTYVRTRSFLYHPPTLLAGHKKLQAILPCK